MGWTNWIWLFFFSVVPLRQNIGLCSYLILAVQKRLHNMIDDTLMLAAKTLKYVRRFLYQSSIEIRWFSSIFSVSLFVAIESSNDMRRKPVEIKMENKIGLLNEMVQSKKKFLSMFIFFSFFERIFYAFYSNKLIMLANIFSYRKYS